MTHPSLEDVLDQFYVIQHPIYSDLDISLGQQILELDFVLRKAVARWSWEPTNLFLHILRPINDGLKTHPKVVNA